jgi:hypothetical protein
MVYVVHSRREDCYDDDEIDDDDAEDYSKSLC